MRRDSRFFHGFQEEKKAVINGPRPSPLMINKDSHLIRKPSSQQRKPIIIYTVSPKIIHTKAQDFMALVQRLTGMSSSNSNNESSENFGSSLSDVSNNSSGIKQQQMNETSSALRRDNDIIHEDNDDDDYGHNKKSGASIHQYSPNTTSLMNFADMPLFTPNSSSDIFCSSRSLLFKHSDSSPYGILGNLISPSGLEFIKELPEY